jgi:hypothetical protein
MPKDMLQENVVSSLMVTHPSPLPSQSLSWSNVFLYGQEDYFRWLALVVVDRWVGWSISQMPLQLAIHVCHPHACWGWNPVTVAEWD